MNGIEFLLDANMVIGLLKGHAPATSLAEQAGFSLEKAAVSQISRIELLGYPKLTDEEERGIRTFLAACKILLLDERIEAGAIRLRRSGAFKLPDAIIVASAMTASLRLLTLDQEMVHGMQRLPHD